MKTKLLMAGLVVMNASLFAKPFAGQDPLFPTSSNPTGDSYKEHRDLLAKPVGWTWIDEMATGYSAPRSDVNPLGFQYPLSLQFIMPVGQYKTKPEPKPEPKPKAEEKFVWDEVHLTIWGPKKPPESLQAWIEREEERVVPPIQELLPHQEAEKEPRLATS